MRRSVAALLLAAALLVARAAGAQQQQSVPGVDHAIADQQQRISDTHYLMIRNAEATMGDVHVYADQLEFFTDEDRAVATGNVLVVQGMSRISADRAEFNTKTKLGTFTHATGYSTLKPQPPQPGAIAVPMSTQPTDVYFYGDEVEKIGAKKYRITNGGFTTCVQPTPRWQLTSKTTILNLDHYTVLRDAIFSVKGVPMLYTPILYYPTKKGDRATGFLIPTYGTSTLRGQSIHDAFFWAIDRSQDATFMHDWYSKTGQGGGGEYRYNFGALSNGDFSAHILDEHESTFVGSDGTITTQPASQSFEIRGGANQALGYGLRARANVNYFSDLTTMQTFNTNIYDASRSMRNFGGNIVGAWKGYSLNATVDRNEYFYSATNSGVSGDWPRVSLARSERPIPGTPLYMSVNGEYASLLRESNDTENPANNNNLDVSRLDFLPQVRFPFTRWQFFTVNSSVSWRDTYYTRTVDPNNPIAAVDDPLNRRYFTVQAQMVGPVFTRVWDTPDNGYAEKFKHTIEPFFNIQKTSNVENFDQIIRIDGTDAIVGGTQYTYGVNNRFYAKRRIGATSQAREIVTVQITQTYYTNQAAAQFDPRYTTSFSGTQPSNFSPISLSVRAVPSDALTATFNTDIDARYHAVRTLAANGTYTWTGRLQTTLGWSKRNFIPELDGFNDPTHLDQSITANTNVHTRDNRLGTIYSFNYDIFNGRMLQQNITAFYNAQCCGIAMQYQTFNLGGISTVPGIAADHRFFLSFTLAGIGNFSPFNGAMSGVPR